MNYFWSGPVNTNWGPGPVNTNWGPGSVNTNWGQGPEAKQRDGGRETERPGKLYYIYYVCMCIGNSFRSDKRSI